MTPEEELLEICLKTINAPSLGSEHYNPVERSFIKHILEHIRWAFNQQRQQAVQEERERALKIINMHGCGFCDVVLIDEMKKEQSND